MASHYLHDQLFDLSFGAAPAGKILLRADPDFLSIDSEGQFELVDGPFLTTASSAPCSTNRPANSTGMQ